MLRNYLTIGLRNLTRHKGYTFINVLGLTVGLACFLLIALYVKDELSYDRHHAHADRIYRVTRDWVEKSGTVSLHLGHVAPPFGPLLRSDFGEIEQVVRLLGTSPTVNHGEKTFNEESVFFAEENLFKVFTFRVTQGNPDRALADPFTVMLSQPMAEKYFKGENPVGKTLRFNNQFPLTVSGVFEPLPPQSHFHPQMLISFKTLEDDRVYGKEGLRTNFGNNSFATYLLLPPGYDAGRLTARLPAFIDKNVTSDGDKPSRWTRLYLQKLTDIHLRSHLDSEIEANGDINYIYIFSAIGVLVLLIACINYMNLATARSAGRAREVGLRKVIGARRGQLVGQFLSESAVLTVVALLLALVLAVGLLPYLNNFTGKSLTFRSLLDGPVVGIVVALALVTGLAAGSYPAFFLASFQPVKVLKGRLGAARNGGLRQSLVVVQFAISIFLIICTTVVYRQLHYIEGKSLGYRKDQVLVLPAYSGDSAVNYQAFKDELRAGAAVKNAGRSSRIPSGRLLDTNGAQVMKGDSLAFTDVPVKFLNVDHDFIPTYEMKLLAGRNFSRQFATDDTTAFILNETAVKRIGWKNAEMALDQPFAYGERKGRIIGVLQDFHFESLHEEIVPMVLLMNENRLGNLSVSIAGSDVPAALAHVEKTWKKFLPNRPFEYEFLDQQFEQLYRAENTRGTLFTTFAAISIFIACLGLFGLASFTITQRRKEISVRKVLGSSVTGIVALLSKEFVRLVGIAFVLAIPLAWYF
ncbi:MAG: ABC transporter permease, partial [Cytophagales bacterium]|nr:ABC transporter permease [Cytophagales bacterium]